MQPQLLPITAIVEEQHRRIGQLEFALHDLLMELRNLMQGIMLLDLLLRERPEHTLADHADTVRAVYRTGMRSLMPSVECSTELLNKPYGAGSGEAYQALLSRLAMMHLLYEHWHACGPQLGLAPELLSELEALWELIQQQHSARLAELLLLCQRCDDAIAAL